jgi:polyhydroxybutyrate depolymerase
VPACGGGYSLKRKGVALGLATVAGTVVALVVGAGQAGCSPSTAAPSSSDAPSPPPAATIRPPDLQPGQRRPLLVVLHGLGGSGAQQLEDFDLALFARGEQPWLVAPDGRADKQGRRFWNAGDACCNFDRAPVDDVARLAALIDAWRRRPDVDPARVYVLGFSNGGFMAHRLACRIGDRLAGVASLAGAGPASSEPCDVRPFLAVLEVHGEDDPIVRHGGGRVFDIPSLAVHPSAGETIRAWAARLGCVAAAPSSSAKAGARLDLDPRLPGAETSVIEHQRCARGAAALWTIRGGGHAISTPQALAEVWRYLARHAKK